MSCLALTGGTPVRDLPFPTWPVWNEGELEAAAKVINSGVWGGKNGTEGPAFEEEYARMHGARYAVATNSGTSALTVALSALGAGPGDEVIVPAYTYIATPAAVLATGAIPIFADIEPDTFLMDPVSVATCITDRTVGIVPVHLGGCPADMDSFLTLAGKHGLFIVEDAAQAWGGQWRDKRVGHIGDAGIFSFQASKNITSGEGGMVLTDSQNVFGEVYSRVNAGRYPDQKGWELSVAGGNFRMPEISAALLRVQLKKYPEMQAKRQENANYLSEGLRDIEGYSPLEQREGVTAHAYHLYMFRFEAEEWGTISRDMFIKAMMAEGIPTYPGYTTPLYNHPVFAEKLFHHRHSAQGANYKGMRLAHTEQVCRTVGLWFSQSMLLGNRNEMDDILAAAAKISEHRGELVKLAA